MYGSFSLLGPWICNRPPFIKSTLPKWTDSFKRLLSGIYGLKTVLITEVQKKNKQMTRLTIPSLARTTLLFSCIESKPATNLTSHYPSPPVRNSQEGKSRVISIILNEGLCPKSIMGLETVIPNNSTWT